MNAITKATSVAVLATLGLALTVGAAEPPATRAAEIKITHDWPSYYGPDGTYADPSKVPLLDDIGKAKLLWGSEHERLGHGKTSSKGGHTYGDRSRSAGSAGLIVADGLVIVGYFDPKNNVVSDGRMLGLIESYLKAEVMDTLSTWTPEEGSPQGAVLSPLLSNIYLDGLDHEMAGNGYEMVRYADDFVVLCRSEQEAREALERVQRWTAQAGLTLHPVKTRIVDATQRGGFDFLGYHFERGYHWPRKKSMGKLRESIRSKTPRTSGRSLPDIIRTVNLTLCGWYEYFKHSHKTTFPAVDGWVRMRLRSILRKRAHRRGRGRGQDHQRWPNAFSAAEGLFSLTAAHAAARQPRPG